jgi:hypothetical protein
MRLIRGRLSTVFADHFQESIECGVGATARALGAFGANLKKLALAAIEAPGYPITPVSVPNFAPESN